MYPEYRFKAEIAKGIIQKGGKGSLPFRAGLQSNLKYNVSVGFACVGLLLSANFYYTRMLLDENGEIE